MTDLSPELEKEYQIVEQELYEKHKAFFDQLGQELSEKWRAVWEEVGHKDVKVSVTPRVRVTLGESETGTVENPNQPPPEGTVTAFAKKKVSAGQLLTTQDVYVPEDVEVLEPGQ